MSHTKIVPPTSCPSCSALLYWENDQLFCPNNVDCPAQTSKRLQNFCKVLKIKGFGEATIETLGFTTINDLITVPKQHYLDCGISDKVASKLLAAIQERIEQGITVQEFVSAMSIPLIGATAASKVSGTMDSLEFKLGPAAAENLRFWLEAEWPVYRKHWNDLLITKSQTPVTATKGTVVITGKLNDFKNRTEASAYLAELGFEVKTTVSKATDYLICEDGSRGSSYNKATQLNITILTIKELEEKLINE